MLIDINEDFKKICSIEGDKLKDFGGRTAKGGGEGERRAEVTLLQETNSKMF